MPSDIKTPPALSTLQAPNIQLAVETTSSIRTHIYRDLKSVKKNKSALKLQSSDRFGTERNSEKCIHNKSFVRFNKIQKPVCANRRTSRNCKQHTEKSYRNQIVFTIF